MTTKNNSHASDVQPGLHWVEAGEARSARQKPSWQVMAGFLSVQLGLSPCYV